MGKITAILSTFLVLAFLIFQAPPILADTAPQDICPVKTEKYQGDPSGTPLTLSDGMKEKEARFIVTLPITPPTDLSMEFKCGSFNAGRTASALTGNNIYIDFKPSLGSANPCEFSEGLHEIWVTSGKYQICRSVYEVVKADALCKLELDPQPGKDSPVKDLTELKVEGYNPVKNIDGGLFLDNQKIDIVILHTSKTTLATIEKIRFSKPGRHRIHIRTKDDGPALCPLDFMIKSPDEPIQVLEEKDLTICVGGPNCAKAASLPCDTTKPSVKTAIGCIHTEPADLIADVLKFALGISGGLAFLMMLLGAFQMLTSAGNPETLAAGKDRLTSAVIGLLFVIFAVLLLQIIGVDILGILQR